ncbi:hypothetical protein D4764_01G0004190 [Takifugu flavidus]|uniref:Uncharacterized protein n=1 Tax=Takifugu flavidus TaxID=433684 RepID=A0A5C6PLJ7_9TELE|nr:hypothetical protein D4764_01G0004190 [Takifugu flavidus]
MFLKALETTVEARPMLNKAKLRTELSLIYENVEFRTCTALICYNFNREQTSEIKTFLRTTITQDHLNALAMLSVEKERRKKRLTESFATQ